jgi:hypothetical protein
MPKPPLKRRGQWSLIGLLLCLAIMVTLASIVYPQVAARHSQPGEPRTPIERGYGTACAEYTSQLNMASQMYRAEHDDRSPTRLEQLKKYNVTDDMIHAEGCYFVIDPETGNVSDRGLSQARPDAPPASYTNPTPPSSTPAPPLGFHGDSEDSDSSGITPNTTPQSRQSGPGGVNIPHIPGSGM